MVNLLVGQLRQRFRAVRVAVSMFVAVLSLTQAASLSAAVPVSTQPLSGLLQYPEQSAPAQVHSLNISHLSAQVSGRIDSIEVRVGDPVEAGQKLVVLDCREYLAQRDAQRAIRKQYGSQIKLAESQLKRSLDLHSRSSISEEKVELRETELNVLRAQAASQMQQLSQAELMVERCTIKAPFAGVVRQRLAGQGELANPGTELLELQQLDQLEVVAEIRPGQLEQLPQQLQFRYDEQDYPLTLRRVLPLIDPKARTRQLRLDFSADAAPPGASGRLLWRSERGYLPADLLVRRDGQLGVMTQQQGKARFVQLPGAIEGQPVAISRSALNAEALLPDSQVIIEGRQALHDGDPVSESH